MGRRREIGRTEWTVLDFPGKLVGIPLCPDLLTYSDIGAADTWRGRVVRVFFWVMRWWPEPGPQKGGTSR